MPTPRAVVHHRPRHGAALARQYEQQQYQRVTARREAAERARSMAKLRSAGLRTEFVDTRIRSVKKLPGQDQDASLGSFGSLAWASRATPEAPRLATTNMMSYGIVAVPSWAKDVHKSPVGLEDRTHNEQPLWLGTRYAKLNRPDSGRRAASSFGRS